MSFKYNQSNQKYFYTGFFFLALPAHSCFVCVSLPLLLQLTFSLLPLRLFTLSLCVLTHELSVLPAIPIIVPCLGAENRGVKSELCRAWLLSIGFSRIWLPVMFVTSWWSSFPSQVKVRLLTACWHVFQTCTVLQGLDIQIHASSCSC